MSEGTYDVQGEVRDALNTAVEGYGKRVLNDPRVLGNLVTDLLPDLPRERSLLVTGAEAGVADELTQHVEGQHMDAGTAVSLVARSLAQSRSLEPAASMWVATEYAKALGYQVRSQVPPPAETVTDTPGWQQHDETQTAGQVFPSAFPPPTPLPPFNPGAGQMPPAYPPPGQVPPAYPQPSPMPPAYPAPGQVPPGYQGPGAWPAAPTQQRKSRLGLFLGGGAAAVIVLYLAIAAAASTFPFAKPTPTPTPTQHPTAAASLKATSSASSSSSAAGSASASSSASATATGTLAALPAGLKPLKVLLPTDIQDATSECAEQEKIPWTNPGLVQAFTCTAPDMPNGQIFGYQLDSTADYNQAWSNYNTWANFGTSSTDTCPPGTGQTQGGPGEWWGPRFPQRAGQVIECFTSDSGPVYVWTYPTENAFIVAQPDKSWTFSKLETWWENNSV
jgi:hypothetical protein